MANRRDNFTPKTKELLAKRAGYLCSNPNCRKPTIGATLEPNKWNNKGIAAHICAAAKGGPRYDESMTSQKRSHASNGIWLCSDCATVIDNDEKKYTVQLLYEWKKDAENKSMTRLAVVGMSQVRAYDIALIRFYAQCLDRPAFQNSFYIEGYMDDFDRALEDTINAINTGVLRTRKGDVLKVSEGKSAVQNPEWRNKLNAITRKISGLRRKLETAKKSGEYIENFNGSCVVYNFCKRELPEWFNTQRAEILRMFSEICKEAGLPEVQFACYEDRC